MCVGMDNSDDDVIAGPAADGPSEEETAAKVAQEIKRLREARGLTQKELGDMLGQLSGSRISQLENHPARLSEDLLLRLAGELGDDILRAARWGPFKTDPDFRESALVALWRIRVDVMSHPNAITSSSLARSRARMIAAELEAVACRTSEARGHVRNGRLTSLQLIAGDLPLGIKMILAVEAMGMVMDAPLHILTPKDRGSARRVAAEIIEEELGLPTLAARSALEHGPRPLWNWEDMTCAGGSLGQLHALCSGDWSVLLLRGFDPAGWMGWGMAGGIWQVRPNTMPADGTESEDADAVARLGGNLGGGVRRRIPPIQRLVVADAALSRIARGNGIDLRDHPSMHWLGQADPDLWHVLLTAKALGRHWVRQQANRLYAIYNGFPEAATGDPEADLPPRDHSIAILARLHEAAAKIVEYENRTSGVSGNLDHNEGLRLWEDMKHTWEITTDKLANS